MAKGKTAKAKTESPHKGNPGAFLDLPPDASDYDRAKVVILPMPLEESVSYGGGTAGGPDAIITASRQVELYDIRLDAEPAMKYGVHTLPAPFGAGVSALAALEAIEREAVRHIDAGKFVVGLGGEHTATIGLAKAVATAKGEFVLVHIDAHADLRDSYEGNFLSHACVVRRIAELPECSEILQLGIRSTTGEQVEFAHESKKVTTWYADSMHRNKDWKREFRKAVKGKRVFLTFDVDGLDPAVVPATGTPEPDGMTWRQLMRAAEIIAKHADTCLAMDCVELAPVPELRYADFTVARALYAMITLFVRAAVR